VTLPPDLVQFAAYGPLHARVMTHFGYTAGADQRAAQALAAFLGEVPAGGLVNYLKGMVQTKPPCFVGAGDSVDEWLGGLPRTWTQARTLVAADGAARALMSAGILPDVVFTDLDGLGIEDLRTLSRGGAALVIHAHGDNLPRIESLPRDFPAWPRVIGTCQGDRVPPLLSPGGFTDGDRALCFFHHLCPPHQPFVLVGYDLAGPPGRWSKPAGWPDPAAAQRKLEKLRCARAVIAWLRTLGRQFLHPSGDQIY
jgi:uncharacterized Rossmann fold enzyme